MTAFALLSSVEQPDLAARLTVASNLRTFLRAAQHETAIGELAKGVQSDRHVFEELIRRIQEIVFDNPQPGFRADLDVALAIYLWVLSASDDALAASYAKHLNTRQTSFFWSARISERIAAQNRESGLVLVGSPSTLSAAVASGNIDLQTRRFLRNSRLSGRSDSVELCEVGT